MILKNLVTVSSRNAIYNGFSLYLFSSAKATVGPGWQERLLHHKWQTASTWLTERILSALVLGSFNDWRNGTSLRLFSSKVSSNDLDRYFGNSYVVIDISDWTMATDEIVFVKTIGLLTLMFRVQFLTPLICRNRNLSCSFGKPHEMRVLFQVIREYGSHKRWTVPESVN